MTLTPKQKLVGASIAALTIPLAASFNGASSATAARIVIAVLALGGLVFWFVRAKGGLGFLAGSKFKSAPRLNVVQRVGLSPRTGLALIEVDGKPYLVVHGDGFARIRPARGPTRAAPLAPEVLEETSTPS